MFLGSFLGTSFFVNLLSLFQTLGSKPCLLIDFSVDASVSPKSCV